MVVATIIIASSFTTLVKTSSVSESEYVIPKEIKEKIKYETVGMGIVLLLEPTFIKNIIVTLIGVFLIIDGGSNLWTISRVAKYVKEKQQEENAIDSEAVVVEEKRGR